MKNRGQVRKQLTIILVLMLLISNIGFVYGNDQHRTASISELTGDVSIMKAGGERAIKAFKGMNLTQGDTIITGRNASATVEINKDSSFMVTENTRLLISELLESSSKYAESTLLNLQAGGVWSSLKKKLNSNSKFEINTPTSKIGARV